MGNPFLHARHAAAFCHKLCAGHICAVKKKVGKHVLALAVGDIDGDALVGDFARRAEFGAHAAAPERGVRLPYYGIDIHPGIGFHAADDARLRQRWVAVVNAVDIRQYHKRVHIHHRGDESRQLIVVGKHQLGERHCVVFVDNGDDSIFKHHFHAMFLIEIMPACREAFLQRQHLTARHAVVAEKLIIVIDELHLSNSRKQLAGTDRVKAVDATHLTSPGGYGARRYHNHFHSCAA